jgi:hypothetical protein
VIFEFPDGITGESFGPGRGNLFVSANASFSPDARLLAQTSDLDGPGALLRVSSTEDRSVNQVVRDPDGDPYRVEFQRGRRWLDDHRLIFWDEVLMKALLWDTESLEAREIEDADKDMGTANVFEFVFSRDGQTLFRQITTIDSDIYLLELSR